ncbi:MAG: penicillin-binding protein activator [bacterium]|nr:penicillin-binding protein activator [bacterium]
MKVLFLRLFSGSVLIFTTASLGMLGCASTGGLSSPEGLSPAHGDSLYAEVVEYSAAGEYEEAESSARELIYYFPRHKSVDEVHFLAAAASFQLENYSQAVKYATAVIDKYSVGPYTEDALFLLAEADLALEKYYDAADVLCRLLASPIDADASQRAMELLRALSQGQLTVSDLERLLQAYPSTTLSGEMSLAMAKREFARGNYDRTYELLSDLLYEFPQHKRTREVRQLLELTESRRTDPARPSSYVEPFKVGVMLPETGSYARFGRYFERGVAIAVEEHNQKSENLTTVVKADTKGDPIDAVRGVKRLVTEEGVVGVLGAVLPVPTVVAAVECSAWRVPMLSPVASHKRIDEIGPWVFQTRISTEVEVSAMAKVAVENLTLERFAILAPESREGQQYAELFVQQILRRGAQIVAEELYRPGDTDFKPQLEVIREAAPDALFIPGDAEELVYVLPQVAFYDMQIQLLGLSNWNSERLLRLSKRELEGALFPREAYHGRDRSSRIQFETRYKELYGGDVHSVASAGYFGMRLLLRGFDSGVIDREQLRDFLQSELNANPTEFKNEAMGLSILKVSSGQVREFTALGARN